MEAEPVQGPTVHHAAVTKTTVLKSIDGNSRKIVSTPPKSPTKQVTSKIGVKRPAGHDLTDFGFTAPMRKGQKTTHGTVGSVQKGSQVEATTTLEDVLPAIMPTVPTKANKGKKEPNVTLGHAEAFGQPHIWSDNRQQICEVLPWYRAHEASAYTNDKRAYGVLIDTGNSPRAYFSERVIICTLGGGRKADPETGRMERVGDHRADSSDSISFKNSMENKRAVGVIMGAGYKASPVKLNHYYNVLGFYHVIAVWYDFFDGLKTWMIKLERIDPHIRPWFSVKTDAWTPPVLGLPAASQTCGECMQSSKQVYRQGWFCLNSSCEQNWAGITAKDANELTYNSAFLQEHVPFTGTVPNSLAPIYPETPAAQALIPTDIPYKQGYVCPQCCCCMRRVHWTYWVCENEQCDFEAYPPLPPLTLHQAQQPVDNWTRKPEFYKGGIERTEMDIAGFEVNRYWIPADTADLQEEAGYIYHFKSTNAINQKPQGPDELLHLLQTAEFDLKRGIARGGLSKTQKLTSHFGRNFGADYKFGVKQDVSSFADAPDVILQALKRVTYVSSKALEDCGAGEFENPNELLCLGYHMHCDIGWHDDGEDTLGPTIACACYGAGATMFFRPKGGHGKKATKFLGTKSKNAKLEKAAMLCLDLEHGDMVIMHGEKIQKFYDHCVKPYGTLRFALTARNILFEKIKGKAEKEKAMQNAILPARAKQFVYHGEDAGSQLPVQSQGDSDDEDEDLSGEEDEDHSDDDHSDDGHDLDEDN